MDLIKLAVIAVCSSVIIVLLKQHRPEFAVFVQLSCIAVAIAFAVSSLGEITDTVKALVSRSVIDSDYVRLLIKALLTAIVTQITADICRDNDNAAAAGAVELAGRAVIISMALPVIASLAQISLNLIED